MFARLDLDLQKRFGSKHALTLWELCTDYLGAKRDYGETPWISVDDFRLLMGIEKEEYARFNNLNLRVISPALAEVNNVSDFRVTVEYQHKGRKITALKFKMRRVVMLPEPANTQATLFPELDDMPQLVRELTDSGLSTQDAFEIWQRGFDFVDAAQRPKDTGEDAETAFMRYVREKIHLLKRSQNTGKVNNSTGFLLAAIRRNYANPEYGAEKQKEARREQQQAAASLEKKRKELEQQKEAIEAARDRELRALYGRIMEDAHEVIEQAVAVAMKESQGLRFLYEQGKTALQNYQDRPAIQALVNPYVERHAPERFETVKQTYEAQISALDMQIKELSI